MFGLGMPEILMILAIALIVIGPKKLPDLAKTLGRAMGEFKRSAQDFKQSIDMETTVKDVTDLENLTKENDPIDETTSEFNDKTKSKASDTDNLENDIEDIDPPFKEDQNLSDDNDLKQQDNNQSNGKSDTI